MATKNDKTGIEELASALNEITKKYGEGSIMQGKQVVKTERSSTGSLGLDCITGGGWGRGRVHEVYGPESSGKSTLCILSMVAAQKNGEIVAYIDTEQAFDKEYAEKLGLDVDKLLISQPDSGEQAFDIAISLVKTGKIGFLAFDSIAASTPIAEMEAEMDESQMGLQARMMAKGLRKINSAVNNTKTTVLFTNQLRMKIGVVYGNPETTPGGNSMKFYASIRADMRASKGDDHKETGARLNTVVTCRTIKNKLAAPFQACTFKIVYGEGIDRALEVVELAVFNGIIKQAGSWFSYGDTKLGQGKESVKLLLLDNPELYEELESQIKACYGI